MNKDFNNLVKITLAHLDGVCFSDDQIMMAMEKAISKQSNMKNQLEASYMGDREVFDGFRAQVAGLVYDAVNK